MLAYDQRDLYRRGRRRTAKYKPNQSLDSCWQQHAIMPKGSDIWAESPMDNHRKEVTKADGVCLCVHEGFSAKRTVSPFRILKPCEMHSFCLCSVAAVINPSLLPWGMAGGTIISLRSKAGDFTLCFIICYSGQVFWKVRVIVVIIGIDGVTPQPSTYGSATLTSLMRW